MTTQRWADRKFCMVFPPSDTCSRRASYRRTARQLKDASPRRGGGRYLVRPANRAAFRERRAVGATARGRAGKSAARACARLVLRGARLDRRLELRHDAAQLAERQLAVARLDPPPTEVGLKHGERQRLQHAVVDELGEVIAQRGGCRRARAGGEGEVRPA